MEYTVTYVNHTDASVIVDATSVAEALEKADATFGYPRLCHQCSDERNDGDWEPTFVTDADGNEHPAD